jgi:Tfp pilus assembly protein PilO
MILAWLLLLTGLTISAVAIYYSVVGLTAIFSAAVIPIIIMGSALEVGKLVCASWLKANWEKAPRFMKYYMISAVMVLMLITSMGIFGFLSKAHNDQNLVSGDVQSKIAIYDEKIKTAKDNIEANRKQLKQMDEAVDQIMGRSTDEKGADKANAVRKSQLRDRQALAKDIEANQKLIASLNDEAAPIRAEVRKVEAEVGPIKYIAKFIYGEKGADENMLEQAVTWIIILIVIVFDPLAVIMLLAAQMTFGWMREQKEIDYMEKHFEEVADSLNEVFAEPPPAVDLAEEANAKIAEIEKPVPEVEIPEEYKPPVVEEEKSILESHPYLLKPFNHFTDTTPIVHKPEAPVEPTPELTPDIIKKIETGEITFEEPAPITVDTTEVKANEPTFQILPELEEESKKKTSYMIKQGNQQIVKTKE